MSNADPALATAMTKLYLGIGLTVVGAILVFYGIYTFIRGRFVWPFSRTYILNYGLRGRSGVIAGVICLLLGIGAWVLVYHLII